MGVRGTWKMKQHLRKRVSDIVHDKNLIRVSYSNSENPKAMDWEKVFPRKPDIRPGKTKYIWDETTKKFVPEDQYTRPPEPKGPEIVIH